MNIDERDITPEAKKRAAELLDEELAGAEKWPLAGFGSVRMQYLFNRVISSKRLQPP